MNNDLISREAVIERIKYEADVCNSGITRGVLKLLQAIVEKMPSAVDAVEVVHAKWEWDENAMDWGLGGWICGKCHAKNDNIPAKPDVCPSAWVGSHFCPNCGARMDGE